MPELPEAENICRALKKMICGKNITKVEIFTPAMRTSLLPLPEAALPGHTIVDVRRRGRYLVAELDDGRGLLMHFGMSGVVRVEGSEVPRRKHEHIFVHLSDGSIFRFECTRRFSLFEVCDGCANGSFPPQLDKLGAEPLSKNFTAEYLHSAFAKRSCPVKTALMDNAIVVGIGNIYANETLFVSGIDPRRKASSLSLKECSSIVKNSVTILKRAIECGGTTISDFLNVDGSEGKFAGELLIYGRENLPCPRCQGQISKTVIGGRSSFFCERCQK